MGMQQVVSEIIAIREISPGIFYMVVRSAEIARQANPGQFVMLRIPGGNDPLLRRPFSLCGVSSDCVEILFKVCGRGTGAMAEWAPGLKISLIGPLGNGFRISEPLGTACLVAGGIGLAPLVFLAKRIHQAQSVTRLIIYMGAKTGSEAGILDAFELKDVETHFATEDGTRGYSGLVTDLVKEQLPREVRNAQAGVCLFGCGPQAMSKSLSKIAADSSVPCRLSIESMMACGTGACLGCAVSVASASVGPQDTKRVCVDGPVFDSREIV